MKKKDLLMAADRFLCVMNGVVGHRLEKRKSRLSIQMKLYHQGAPLGLTEKGLRSLGPSRKGKVCLLLHGSCNSENDWFFSKDRPENYGSLFESDFGHTPLYLRYNTGLHVSTNGRRLSDLLEKFIENYPGRIQEIVVIGYSMGGLILRSACHYARQDNRKWLRVAKRAFYIGSPHCGTHFEKFGKLTSLVLKSIPHLATRAIGSLIDLRSDGIKDMRHGYLIDEDWKTKNADRLFHFKRNVIPLADSIHHYQITGTISKDENSRWARVFGDGLVHPASGAGVPTPKSHIKILPGITHRALQRSPRVYEQIKSWYSQEPHTHSD